MALRRWKTNHSEDKERDMASLVSNLVQMGSLRLCKWTVTYLEMEPDVERKAISYTSGLVPLIMQTGDTEAWSGTSAQKFRW